MSGAPTAGMVVIGNEILSGKIQDSNSPYLARELRALGVALECVIVIPDELDIIAHAVADFSKRFDFVFTSGGIGPTHDDVTIEGVARAFGVPVIEHESLRSAIEELVGDRVKPAHLKMAQTPDGAELVGDKDAPFPTVLIRNVYVLPGIPEIFEAKIDSLRERFRARPYHLRQVLVAKNETQIAPFLDATLEAFPDLMLGSYPKLAHPEYAVKLTLESKDESYVDQALADLVGRMPDGFVVRVV